MNEQKIKPGPFVLASLLTSYPDLDFQSAVTELLQDENITVPELLKKDLSYFLQSTEKLDELRSDYIEIFDHSKSLNPLYETEFGRERAMFKANELSDIAGFYRAFGFEMDQDGAREMVDHVSVELEFYSLLQMKHLYLQEMFDMDGCEIVHDAMKKFMDAHLGRFVPAILERQGVQNSTIYKQVFSWVQNTVDNECSRLGVKPERATWFSSQVADENVCCGGTVAINK